MSIWIKDKTVLITGSTNGIGMAAALKLAEDCSSLFFTYRNDELADQLKKELSMINPELHVQGFFVISLIKNPSEIVCLKLKKM